MDDCFTKGDFVFNIALLGKCQQMLMEISNQSSTFNPNIQKASYNLNKNINGLYIYTKDF